VQPADDALGLAMQEVNALSKTLRDQRLGALEATALLRKVMEEIKSRCSRSITRISCAS
jgi:signal transduction histidine kinase